MMLYGASTMGSCYLIAAICLQKAQQDESKEQIVWPTFILPFLGRRKV